MEDDNKVLRSAEIPFSTSPTFTGESIKATFMWSAEQHKRKTQERGPSVPFLPSSFLMSWQAQQLPDPNSGPHAYANTPLTEPSLHRLITQLPQRHSACPKQIEAAQINQAGRKNNSFSSARSRNRDCLEELPFCPQIMNQLWSGLQ